MILFSSGCFPLTFNKMWKDAGGRKWHIIDLCLEALIKRGFLEKFDFKEIFVKRRAI